MRNLMQVLLLALCLVSYAYGQNRVTMLRSSEETKIEKEQNKLGTVMGRFYQEWLMTHDPTTGLVPRERLLLASRVAQDRRKTSNLRSGIIPIYWNERGPNNVGGRTRALLFDANDPAGKRVWAGSVSGGLWRTNDIDAAPPVWVNIDDYFSNLAITSLAQSPLNPNIMYFGTGEEGFGNADAVQGMGLWRSMDGGNTWQPLPIPNANFKTINKVVVDNAGLVYVATSAGLYRSKDANGNFDSSVGPVLPKDGNPKKNVQDLELAADGTLFAAINGDSIYKYANNSWTSLADSDFPATKYQRIELATAPSNANIIYAAFADSTVNSQSNCINVFVSIDGGKNWAPRSCPGSLGVFCWYAYIMAVDPTDPNRIWLGDVGLFHSTDGGSNWTQIPGNEVHADHHAIVYRTGNANEMVFGNDGGVYRTTNAANAKPALAAKNDGYNVTQFYANALHPTAASNYILGGTQDNGTQRFNCAGICATDRPTGNDGGFCFIDQDNPKIQITGSQTRNFFLSTNSGTSFSTLLNAKATTLFITPADYADAENVFYFSDGIDTLGRIVDVGVANTVTFERITQLNKKRISIVKVSPNTANRIWVGTEAGRILRIDNAHQPGMATVTLLDSIFASYVSSIEVEVGNDNHLLVTTSAYNQISMYETVDGGKKWTQIEGDLPDMPVRWVMFHPFDANQALVATELGVWTTDDLAGNKTEWFPTNTFGLANVRVDMLQYRSSDHLVAAASHGRGMYTTDYFNLLKTACPPNLMISGAVTSGLYLAKDFIVSDGTIAAGKSVIYHAGNFIQLKENFRAAPGSFFIAAIQDCNMLVAPPTASDRFTEDQVPVVADAPTMKCYPNPATYKMTIQLNLPVKTSYNLHVRRLDGRLVGSLLPGTRTALGEQWHDLDTSQFDPGVYFLLLQTATGATIEKFVVVK